MSKIDTSQWGNFRVGDLFNAERGKVKNLQNQAEGNTPVIAAGGFNQGIAGMYDVPALYENKITVSCNGAGCGSVFYHPYEFNLNGDAIVLTELQPMSDLTKQFISCMLNGVLTRKYSYAEKCSADKAKNEIIKLPVDEIGNPDFLYMESYMKNLELAVSSSLTDLQSAINFSSCNRIDTHKWKTFTISDVFPIIKKPYVYHTKHVTEDENGIPYVVRSKFNNGIKYNVKKPNGSINPAGVISFGAENATFFYQKQEWVSGRDIYYIDTQHLTEYACLFITACLQPIASKYSYNFGLFPDLLKKEKFKLPVNSDGDPDYSFMEEYMNNIFQKTQNTFSMIAECF